MLGVGKRVPRALGKGAKPQAGTLRRRCPACFGCRPQAQLAPTRSAEKRLRNLSLDALPLPAQGHGSREDSAQCPRGGKHCLRSLPSEMGGLSVHICENLLSAFISARASTLKPGFATRKLDHLLVWLLCIIFLLRTSSPIVQTSPKASEQVTAIFPIE